MIVAELVRRLQTLPQDAEIRAYNIEEDNECYENPTITRYDDFGESTMDNNGNWVSNLCPVYVISAGNTASWLGHQRKETLKFEGV